MPLVDHVSQPFAHWLKWNNLGDKLRAGVERATAPINLKGDHLQDERDYEP